MATAVIMPRQGQSVESCIIGEWHKKKGDSVAKGDKLFTYETDKATFDEEAPVDGELIAVFFEEGDDIPVLLNVCVIGEAGEDWSGFIPEGATQDGAGMASTPSAEAAETTAAAAPETGTAAAAPGPEAAPQPAATADLPQEIKDLAISPRARAAAAKAGADLRFVQPTGPKGRVIERDVEALIAAGHLYAAAAGAGADQAIEGTGIGGRIRTGDLAAPAAEPAPVAAVSSEAAYRDVKLPNIRKVIAKAMHASLANSAQLTLNRTFDATDILEFRARLKKAKEAGLGEFAGFSLAAQVPTFNDIILFTVSRIVLNHPEANAHFLDDHMRYFNGVQLGVAVDTPRGLMVPVVKDADRLSITEIAAEVRELAAACQSGTISPDKIKGSSITVTNLGSLGIESFTPVINPPETCILGVNGLQTAVRMEAGQLVGYQAMSLSLTIDHRAWDGAPAARFLQDLCRALEHFSLLLMSN